jgi:hypothetical protein
MRLGIEVRSLYWQYRNAREGARARLLLADCLFFLHRLEGDDGSEYMRNMCLALLFWSTFHDSLAGPCFVEECLEASLSRLSRGTGTDLRATTVQQFADHYLGMGAADDWERDLLRAGIHSVFPSRLVIRLRRLADVCHMERLPFVHKPRRGETTARITAQWPITEIREVPRLFQPVERDAMHGVLLRSLSTLLRPRAGAPAAVEDARAAVRAVCRRVPELPPGFALERQQAIGGIIRAARLGLRPSRKRSREQPASQSTAAGPADTAGASQRTRTSASGPTALIAQRTGTSAYAV